MILAVVALVRCGDTELPSPAPTSVSPGRGFAGNATPVVIQGNGFSVRTVQSASGGAPTVDETFQAWMGDQALLDVHRVDQQTLTATVPAGLSPGVKTLRVQGPFGTSGELPNAFTVEGTALASISATIAAAPPTVSIGQVITVTATVTNTGTTSATGAAPTPPTVSGTGAADPSSGPDPASIATLGPGESETFTWTYSATGAGTLAFASSVHATDSFSGTTITAVTDPASPATVTVVRPAALTASLPSSGAAAFGREFTVMMTVNNTGGAAVKNLVPAVPTVAPSGLAALKAGTGPVPVSVDSLLPGASATFTWTFVAGNTPGKVQFSSSASGNDDNSGAPVASPVATSGDFTVGAAGLNASLSAAPATASVGQPLTLTLTATNPGLADVRNFAVSTPSVDSTDGANAALATGPTPAPPAVLAAGQTVNIAWTYDPALTPGLSSGHLAFGVIASGTDGFSGDPITAQPAASSTVQSPPTLVASLTAARTPPVPTGQPFTVNTGQAFTLSLAVSNTGGASAVAVTATPIAGCAAPSPASSTVTPGNPVVFLYASCSSAAAGTLTPSASASGMDANSPSTAVTSNPSSVTVVVQTPAAVTATVLATSPSTLSVGQAFTVTLTLTKTGTAAANVTGVSLTGTTCATGPAMPVNAIGATLNLTWSGCTAPATPQTLTLAGSVTWVDTNTGTVRTAGPVSASVPVVAAALVAATNITTTPATLSTGQTFSITLTLTKSGGAAANVTVATTSYSPPCLSPPAFPINNIAATQALVWSNCTAPSTAGALALAGSATWEDANVPGVFNTTNLTATSIVVQQAAALSASFAAQPPPTASVGQPLALTVAVSNTAGAGGATANNVTVTASVTGTLGATASCTGASPGASSIAGGASLPFTFTCTPLTTGTLTFTATVNGTAANSGTALTAAATTSPATTIQTPAALAVTFASQPPSPVNAGQVVSLTANVRNTAGAGGAAATTVSVTPSFSTVTGTAAASCSTASPASSTIAANSTVPFTFTCTPWGAGTLTFTATANGTAANTGNALTAAATTSPATIVLAPVVIAPATASVPPRGVLTFIASGGSGSGFTWSLSTNASGGSVNASTGAYTAGATGSVTDVVRVVDSLGNAATRTVAVGPGVSISGVTAVAPRGSATFTASGGSGSGYAWSLSTNVSGGSINASTGVYTAGATPNVTDVVRVVDSLGNGANQNVTVGAGVSISGVTAVAPRGSATFTASGGSGSGYAWSLSTNVSGGSINASTGVYTAGATPNVTDVVRVVDSLGNAATQNVAVGPGVSISGPATVPVSGSATFTASGGSGSGYTWALSTNASGGTINASTGVYTAGATPNVTDVVSVQDSVGNSASATVSVTP